MNHNKQKSDWEKILNSTNNDISLKKNFIKNFSLKESESFIEEGELPKGVLYITKGKLREINLDNDKEPFTTRIYKKNDFVGYDHLLRKEKKYQ